MTARSPKSAQDQALIDERRQCVRFLLQTPLVVGDAEAGPAFRLVRRHADWLCKWFQDGPAWPLQVESEFARLTKYPARLDDASRAARDPVHRRPFTRRKYVMFCLALAVLERSERQTVLGQLAEEVERLGRGDEALVRAGLSFAFERREVRMDLVAVVRVLIELGVLIRVHGSEERYLASSDDVLYTVRRPVLARLLAARRGPSTIMTPHLEERLSQMQSDVLPESDEARRRLLNIRLFRLLLEQPVVYYEELTEQERGYLRGQRARITDSIEMATGLVPELRAEGLAMVDPLRNLTDYTMPEEGTDGHAALLLAEFLGQHLRECPEEVSGVSFTELERFMMDCADEHGARWRRDAREPAGVRSLLRHVLYRLDALKLIYTDGHVVYPRPALARFRLEVCA